MCFLFPLINNELIDIDIFYSNDKLVIACLKYGQYFSRFSYFAVNQSAKYGNSENIDHIVLGSVR